ncbi:ABC transporter permease [Mycobacterium sp. NPDC003449]
MVGKGLGRYLAYRLLLLIPLLFGVSILAFLLVRLGDSSPAVMVAGPTATQSQIEDIEAQMGLDRSLPVQYWTWLTDAVHGDLGTSWQSNRPVTEELAEKLPITLELIGFGMAGAIVFGVIVGVVSAVRQRGVVDQVLRVVTLAGVSIPIFWGALLMIALFFTVLGWAPAPLGRVDRGLSLPPHLTGMLVLDSTVSGYFATAVSALAHLALPVLTIALITGATIAKQTRAAMVETLAGPAVRYARACGSSEPGVVWLALRNALPDLIGFFGITFSLAMGGAAISELIFSWGGIGQLGLEAITNADFAVVQGFILVMGVLTAAVYLVADLLVAAVDPRVKLQ